MFFPIPPSIFPEKFRPNLDMNTGQKPFSLVPSDTLFGEPEFNRMDTDNLN